MEGVTLSNPYACPSSAWRVLLSDNALGSQGFEPTGERVPFAALRERNDEAEELEKLELIRSMRDEGKTLQEIADTLGYKSRSAIANILKRAEL